jgi:hypothetical protein
MASKTAVLSIMLNVFRLEIQKRKIYLNVEGDGDVDVLVSFS